ncbi:class I SAM-dependent methyltransferase [Paraglaciecola aquimarina]|uniref:Ribosomal RNA small subunit methyltransferase J n=1 Tax=Paraglaciecola algarum TaxID=3050085 RepID=A0ABS9D861_9ALTE|nr:class I SAM-dependent methyltransferase [Paraglaciecola sp. G1-23]MCF2949141.1 class I SAM-dependent methyltransferase [Paraglaciecola sp. G1-23]
MPDNLYPTIKITTAPEATAEVIAQAKQTAQQWGLTYQSNVDKGLALIQQANQLELRQLDEPKVGAVLVDFASDALTFRRLHGGGKKEAIAKALGLKGVGKLKVLDATAGLGRDAFVLASLGCDVDMIERSPIVAALLNDGLRRAGSEPNLADWLNARMKLFHGVAYELLANWRKQQPKNIPDVVYLDPMFPHRKKSAAVKKEMRLFQQLLGPDEDANLLLAPALALAKKRVVVKRPSGAPYLADTKPDIEMKGKANRFDVYLIV